MWQMSISLWKMQHPAPIIQRGNWAQREMSNMGRECKLHSATQSRATSWENQHGGQWLTIQRAGEIQLQGLKMAMQLLQYPTTKCH